MKLNWSLYYLFEDLLCKGSDSEIKKLLNQFDVQDYLKIPIVFDLVSYKKLNLLEFLYKKNIPFTYEEEDSTNALHVACGAGGNLKCVKFFVENNILTNINKKSTKYGDTPLTLAISYEHYDIIDYFISKFGIKKIDLEDIYIISDRIKSNYQRI